MVATAERQTVWSLLHFQDSEPQARPASHREESRTEQLNSAILLSL
jgi:hypothetical protein